MMVRYKKHSSKRLKEEKDAKDEKSSKCMFLVYSI